MARAWVVNPATVSRNGIDPDECLWDIAPLSVGTFMYRQVATCLSAVLFAVLGGCGTFANLQLPAEEGGMEVYGGVKADADAVRGLREHAVVLKCMPGHADDLNPFEVAALIGSLDFPLSAIGDTLTLSLTLLQKPGPSAKTNRGETPGCGKNEE